MLKRGGRFGRIYDLQLSQRSAWYFRLLGPRRPEWVGVVPGCSHRYVPPVEPKHIMTRHTPDSEMQRTDAVYEQVTAPQVGPRRDQPAARASL